MKHSVFAVAVAFLAVATLALAEEVTEKGVEIIQGSNLTGLISQHPKLLVFFADADCPNCQDCSEMYAITNQQHPQAAKYTKVYLSNTTRALFQEYRVFDFPRILAFINGKLSPFQYECLGTRNNIGRQLQKWIERLDNSLREWGGEDDHQQQLIVHCQTDQLKKMWKKIERIELWLDIYCGNQTFLADKLVVVSESGRSLEGWQFESSNSQEFEKKIMRLVKAYKYKYVLNWNTAITQEIFYNNQSAFIILVNNESLSLSVYGYLQEIKQKWYENIDKYQPVVFAVSDLARNTYETIRLKHYLSGILTATRRDYPYPMVAFIKAGPRPSKYLFSNPTLSKESLEAWMQSIHEHILLGNPYNDGEEVIQESLNQHLGKKNKEKVKEQDQSEQLSLSFADQPKQMKKQEQWLEILSQHFNSSCFVYFTWRNNFELQLKEFEVCQFWGKKEGKQRSPMDKIPLFVHQLHKLDLPKQLDIRLEYVPSLLYIGADKKMELRQGVTDLDKIKKWYYQKLQAKEGKRMPLHR